MKAILTMNLRNKFMIPTVLIILIGMSISSIFSYLKAQEALSDTLSKELFETAEKTGTIVETWINDRRLDLMSWSIEKTFRTAALDSIIGQAARIVASKQLEQLKTAYGYYEDINITNLAGDVVAGSNPKTIGKINITDRGYFKQAIQGRQGLSEVLKSRDTGDPVIVVSLPLTKDEKVIGVIFGVLDLKTFSSKFVDGIKVGDKGYAFVVDQQGQVIAHPNKSMILDFNINDLDFGQKMMTMDQGFLSYEWKGEERWGAIQKTSISDWRVGVVALKSEILAPVKSLGKLNFVVAVGVILVAGIMVLLLTNSVVNPINSVVAGLKDAAEGEGDLTKRLEVSSKDEVSELAHWFNVFISKMQQIIADVAQNAVTISSSSKSFNDLSGQMSQGTETMASKSSTVANAAHELSQNINSIAAAMEQAATNMNMVATATEQMTNTVSEIASNSEKARSITSEAVNQAESASVRVDDLGKAAQDIGKVTETITEISEQTNLLALNATIEAARAGEAGKGFAVVANEIKELARQTSEATGEIKNRINGIQDSTMDTVTEISQISQIIKNIAEIVSTIATAVEEQSVTTREIFENVNQASKGIQEVNVNVANSSTTSGDIAADISLVNQSIGEISNSSSQVNMSASELNSMAEKLSNMVARFKLA
ncbi:MAG: methyl-accepting chemotaxis protein [Desulfobacteraceae bacterium]|jgi:methyl-accepting chemotaxis protein